MARELREDEIFMRCLTEAVGINETPATLVEGLPVHPSTGLQPSKVLKQISHQVC
jgi:hypothetical protein